MITSSIKTNLILKEIGVTRYSLRSCKEKTNDKEILSFEKAVDKIKCKIFEE